jgi:hypothetical protein
MPHTDIRQVRDCYSALRELVIQRNGGWDDAESRSKVARLCNAAVVALEDPECRERLLAVRSQAEDLFSPSGHLKWSRKQMSGADYLRLQILIHLEAVNTRLFMIEAQRDRAAA